MMQPINALSITPAVTNWLAITRHPHILHVFDRVCNLINERREVLSVVTPQIGNGPFSLVIEDDVLFSDHLNAQSSISIRAYQLHLGNLTIDIANAKLWSPRPNWGILYAKKDHITKLLLANYQAHGGFDTPLDDHSGLLNHQQLPITNYQFSNSLISSIANADLPSSLNATQQLAGLGIGLTPSGDDFIMGAIYAVWIIHPLDVAKTLAEEIVNIAAPLTTSLSAAWLKSAGKGEAGVLWHNLFNALISIDKITVQESMDRLLDIGHTSGADALAGFLGTFIHWAELTSSKIP